MAKSIEKEYIFKSKVIIDKTHAKQPKSLLYEPIFLFSFALIALYSLILYCRVRTIVPCYFGDC